MTEITGLILAAGRGSRMGSATDDNPKCLTRLAGKTLLEWQISAMQEAGISTINAIGGYRRECLNPYLTVLYENEEWENSNMVWSLLKAAETLRSNPCLISYSDIVYHPDIVKKLIEKSNGFSTSYDELWLDLWTRRFADPLSDAESFSIEKGIVQDIGRKVETLQEIHGQFMGLIYITPKNWLKIEKCLEKLDNKQLQKLDMTGLLKFLLQQNFPIQGIPISGRWCEVDSQDDWNLYQSWILNSSNSVHDWRW